MIAGIKKHPFGVQAFFESTAVLTFAVPQVFLRERIPECLELDTYKNTWAFIAVAMVNARNLRPEGFPSILGSNSFQIGYRIFVRYTNSSGKSLRGLYILQSETNAWKMKFLGNIFTSYLYKKKGIVYSFNDSLYKVYSKEDGFKVSLNTSMDNVPGLPENSPFTSWKEAQRFSGPLPFTFSFNKQSGEVTIVEGVREHWEPQAVKIIDCEIPYLSTFLPKVWVPASAFLITNVPYSWKKGKVEQWK